MSANQRPEPPYYAVIFSSRRPMEAGDDYADMAERMVALAQAQPGYLGHESARGADGFGITVSYWESLAAIRAWKAHPEHGQAQRRGREEYYLGYDIRIAKVERAYGSAGLYRDQARHAAAPLEPNRQEP